MTETYFLSSSKQTRDGQEPTRAPFCFAFDTVKTGTGFFGWLEGEIETTVDGDDHRYASLRSTPAFPFDFLFDSVETGPGAIVPPSLGKCLDTIDPENSYWSHQLHKDIGTDSKPSTRKSDTIKNSNRFRLERFGKAMSGTGSWEAPGAVLNGKRLNFLKYMR
jgi:hypothetical protein